MSQFNILNCVNHPDLRWHTKACAPIGQRTIYYNLNGVPGAPRECDCPVTDLRIINVEDDES